MPESRNCWAPRCPPLPEPDRKHKLEKIPMSNELEISLYVLVLAVPLGLELVRRVSPLLHTPLMSLTNAISAISVVGAILVSGNGGSPMLSKVLATIAVMFATINIVAGFLITDRMLKMFKKKETPGK